MSVDKDEDCRSTISVTVTEQVTTSYIGHDVFDGLEGSFDVRGVVHCKEDTGDELKSKEEAGERAVASVVGKAAWGWVGEEVI